MTLGFEQRRSSSREETYQLGVVLAQRLVGGDVVLLHGSIGTGKSVVARAIGDSLGVARWSGSPTFALIHEYNTQPALYHVDLYRLSPAEVEELHLEDLVRSDSVLVVEWADRWGEGLSGLALGQTVAVHIAHVGETEREVCIETVPAQPPTPNSASGSTT